jgi:hypothetical protein
MTIILPMLCMIAHPNASAAAVGSLINFSTFSFASLAAVNVACRTTAGIMFTQSHHECQQPCNTHKILMLEYDVGEVVDRAWQM